MSAICCRVVLFLVLGAAASAPHCASAAEFAAGGYSFSDELGGFRLLSASGTGTPDDPIVVVEEIAEAAPVVLVIRRLSGSERARRAPHAIHAGEDGREPVGARLGRL